MKQKTIRKPNAQSRLSFAFRAVVATAVIASSTVAIAAALPPAAPREVDFIRDVQPIFAKHCYACHGPEKHKNELRLDVKEIALKGGEHHAPNIIPGKSAESPLIQFVAGADPKIKMPAAGEPLAAEEVGILRAWIDQGAKWPDSASAKVEDKLDWWSLKPIQKPAVPALSAADAARVRTPVDTFVLAKLKELNLTPSPEADRRTLVRRIHFDLIGLPPTPEEVDAFVKDPDPKAYEKLVDKLLASPRYGEKWARHWLDVVHYGDTHGYDKDKVRPNAWPYRDYVIRSFNEDKPYAQFVKEQLAGDRFYPDTRDGIVGLGFIAAGPFDFVGQIEVGDGTMEKKRVRNIDRDDMVSATMNTFVSLTAQCARCHNHKFDPISQEDYYSLQAVFAAVDRTDREYDSDPKIASRRQELKAQLTAVESRKAALDKAIYAKAGPELLNIDQRLDSLSKVGPEGERAEIGYHSNIEPAQDVTKWVQVDLGAPLAIDQVIYVGAHDTFNGIGDGFGFPIRYKIEISDDPAFKAGVTVIEDRTATDFVNPGIRPQSVAGGKSARYVRLTATKLALRQNDYILALAEMMVLTADGKNVARGKTVTSLDSIELPTRWARANLVDGYYRGGKADTTTELATLGRKKNELLARVLDDETRNQITTLNTELAKAKAALGALPPRATVFAAASDFPNAGGLVATHGKPRPIFLLNRGNEANPMQEVGPGTVGCIKGLPSRFNIPPEKGESDRRAALADWVIDARNPLTWRSIANRMWYYHFGRGIVETPNDFGRMGALPTHPELLDYLAAEFRDGGQSIKGLHKMIVLSSTYRQSSASVAANAKVDGNNQYLWRMNRNRLDAEAIRDTVLAVSGKLQFEPMGGPGYMMFGFLDDHSPHYKYQEFDPDDVKSHRRSIYRMVVRSVPDPFMETLDCADPSQIVERRTETLTALQALALLNDRFMVRMAEHFATRAQSMGTTLPQQIEAAYRLALSRAPTADESKTLTEVAQKFGLPNACRLILNTNEFVFVD